MSEESTATDTVISALNMAAKAADAMQAKGVVVALFDGSSVSTFVWRDFDHTQPCAVARTLRHLADDMDPPREEIFDRASTIAALRDLLDKLEGT